MTLITKERPRTDSLPALQQPAALNPPRGRKPPTPGPADGYASEVASIARPLPPEVFAAKQAVLRLANANTDRLDNIAEVRAELKPSIRVLEDYFAKNRPSDEVALTRGSWKSLWYDDPDITSGPGFLKLDRSKIWQVIEEGYYYNVSEAKVSLFGKDLFRLQSYLRGNYQIIDPPSSATPGEPRRNVIKLEFDENRARLGRLPPGENVADLVDQVVERERFTFPVPGPRGITGELWNLYVDRDLRISAGSQDGKSLSTDIDLYILRRDR